MSLGTQAQSDSERTRRHCEEPQATRQSILLPIHLAVIMDGNGRWAKQKGQPRSFGHKAGVKAVRELIQSCDDLGIKYLTIYSFSTENWQRPQAEVSGLMDLFAVTLDKELQGLHQNNVILRTMGDVAKLPKQTRDTFARGVELTAHNTGMTLNFAVNYGARAELAAAAQSILDRNDPQLEKYLQSGNLPDPDLLIRTGGEQRISNFMLYQLAYTELYFTDILWPNFTKADLELALAEYAKRQRRFGRA